MTNDDSGTGGEERAAGAYGYHLLSTAGSKVRKRMRSLYPNLRDTDTEAPPPAPSAPSVPESDLGDVTFANPYARALAEAAGLTWFDFAHSEIKPSSIDGYWAVDVEAIINQREEGRDVG